MSFAQPFSEFEILERLGAGAMGTVFKARHKRLDRIVALKVLRPSLARNARYVDRLRREARIVARLDHPNIVGAYDLGEEAGYHFFVMEYVDGKSLRDLLAEWGAFPTEQVLDVAEQVGRALDHAHRRGVTHRDVKPGNVLIDREGRVKLTDLGLAKGPADMTLTRSGATIGTPQYISPEQARDPKCADIRSDLYSLGATLYHMATGGPPFQGETMAEVITRVLSEPVTPPIERNPDLDPGLDLVIRKLLAKDPDLRYRTPAELLEDLERVRRRERPGVDERALAREGSRRRSRVSGLVAGFVTVAIVGVGAWLVYRHDSSPPEPPADPRARLRTQLREEVAEADTLAEKLARLDRVVAAAGPELADTAEAVRAGVLAASRSELDRVLQRFLAEDRERVRAWFSDPTHWREPERFYEEVFAGAVRERFGLSPVALPQTLRSVYAARLEELRAVAKRWLERRDREHLEALRRYLEERVPPRWTAPLQRDPPDFVSAERELRTAIAAFHAGEGPVRREQLPDALLASVQELERRTLRAALERIDELEERVAGDLRAQVDQALERSESRREGISARQTLALLDRLQADLERAFPRKSFRPAHDPWPAVRAKLEAARDKLRRDADLEELARLRVTVFAAYKTLLASGRAADAAEWLELLDLHGRSPRAVRERHLRVLRAAAAARAEICRRLAGASGTRMLVVPRSGEGGGSLEVVVTAAGDISLATDAATPLPPNWVRWSALARTASYAPAAGEPGALGLALWLFVGGEEPAARDLLDADWRRFFVNEIQDAVQAARAQSGADAEALTLLLALERACRAGDIASLERVLKAWSARFEDEAAGPQGGLLRRARRLLARAQERERLLTVLRELTPTGARLKAGDGGEFWWEVSGRALSAVVPARGWQPTPSGLRCLGVKDVSNPDSSLSLATAPGTVDELEISLTLTFDEEDDAPRGFALQAGAVWAAVGLLADGTPLAVLRSGAPASAEELRRALQDAVGKALEEGRPLVVPGAAHELVMAVRHVRRRVQAELRLDGVRLALAHFATRGGESRPGLRLAAWQPLEVRGVRVHGRVR